MSIPNGRVLVVDDDDLFLRVCSSLLKRAGMVVETCGSSSEALTLIKANRYDTIVSDMYMPELTGVGLLQAARSLDATVPFVLMTGAPSVESAISAIDYGVHKYLPKPFDIDVFVSTVSDAVKRRVGSEDLTSLHRRLDRALEGLWMAYQPIVEFSKRRPLAYEALLRTSAPEIKGPPDVLDLAEKTGRLFDLGRAIRRSVASELPMLAPEIDVFVNLHPADLEDPQLYEAGAPLSAFASRVVLEITERASVTHDELLTKHIAALRALGYRVAVDDLGAGYAGLTTLARIQPEFVKLDGSLVRNIDSSSVNQLIVAAVVDLSARMGLKVIAECIERADELAQLRLLGVDLMQGYYFAKPAKPFVRVEFPAEAAAA
jgi:EAL domain-containing protein (putative c-di-GMP-specific phosphodiesterase class I)/CheY-like chemotaxis protein